MEAPLNDIVFLCNLYLPTNFEHPIIDFNIAATHFPTLHTFRKMKVPTLLTVGSSLNLIS